jgi:hypothetical protein
MLYYNYNYDDYPLFVEDRENNFEKVSCFINPAKSSYFGYNTRILCYDEEIHRDIYYPIQYIRIGLYVKTYRHGYKRVKMIGKSSVINNPDDKYRSMYIMKKKGEMVDDLIITGNHSILVDKFKTTEEKKQKDEFKDLKFFGIDGKYILFAKNSDDFEQIKDNNMYTYYHFVLEEDDDKNENTRYGVWANGILAETSDLKHFLQHNYENI